MTCLSAYFDKGGDVSEKVIIVAGFVAEPRHWDLAVGEWRQATGLTNFHMTDRTPEQKDSDLEKLVAIAARHFRAAIAAGVYTRAFAEASLADSKGMVGDPYRLCCLNCIIAVSEWATKNRESPVALFFDKDGKLYNETSQAYQLVIRREKLREKWKVGAINRADRKLDPPIQIADVLAHTLFSFHRERMAVPTLSPGPHLTSLLKGTPEGWLFTNSVEIERWAQLLKRGFEEAQEAKGPTEH